MIRQFTIRCLGGVLCLLCLILSLGCRKGERSKQPLLLVLPFHMSMSGQQFLMRTRMSSMRLRKELEDTLRKGKSIVLEGSRSKSNEGYQLEVSVGMRRASNRHRPSWRKSKQLRALLLVTGQLTPLSKRNQTILLEEQVEIAFRPLRPPTIERVQQAIAQGWQQLGTSLHTLSRLRRQPDEALLVALQGKAPIAQRHAAYLLGQRKVTSAALPLIKLLKSPDERIVTAAVGAIVRLKDQRAALPLIRAASHRQPAFLMQVISALSVLGGEDAQSYLFTLANAHDDKRIRQSANEGLQEIKKRAQPPSSASKHPPRRASSG